MNLMIFIAERGSIMINELNNKIESGNCIKPIIGIVAKVDTTIDRYEVLCTGEYCRKAIVKKTGIPILILPPQDIIYGNTMPKENKKLTDEEKRDLKAIINICDGIVMPGGDKWYKYDEFILNYCIDNDIPVLGICLGMQIMGKVDNDRNNVDGNATYKNKEEGINHCQRDIKYAHKINILDGTILKSIIGKDSIQVNSGHNYHIERTQLFKVSAISEDGIIEAIEIPSKKFIMGVQWHPEKMMEYDEDAEKIIEFFINKTKCKGR